MNLGTLGGGEWLSPRPGRLYPKKDLVPIVQEAGWVSEPVWIGGENLAPTGIRSSDLPARSETLYRLRQPGSYYKRLKDVFFLSLSLTKWQIYDITDVRAFAIEPDSPKTQTGHHAIKN